jgi:hypothetical protein
MWGRGVGNRIKRGSWVHTDYYADMSTVGTSVVSRSPDGTEKRILRVHVDSRNVFDHDNRNPNSYEVELPDALMNISKVRLTDYRVTVSAQFVVVRASRWYGVGGTEDDVHATCRYIEEQNLSSVSSTHTTPVTIYNGDETVQLQVVEAFTVNVVASDNLAQRDYSVFLCTGRMESDTVSTDTFYIADPGYTGASMPQQLTKTASDTATPIVNGRVTYSTTYISTVRTELYLDVYLDGRQLSRLAAPNDSYSTWESLDVYRRGDIVGYKDPTAVGSPTTYYQCIRTHFSFIFSVHLAAGDWVELATVRGLSAANGAFAVIAPDDTNEHITSKSFNKTQVEYETAHGVGGSKLRIDWKNRKGSEYIFPSYGSMNIVSVDDAPYAYGRRVFHGHQLTFEIEYSTGSTSLSAIAR